MNITPQALDFLFENRLKDSKEWYKEHKDIHTKLVVEPFREFVVNITPYMNEIDPAIICNPKKISRIYRDARFSKDKSIFKDNQWCCFMNSERKELYEGLPSFFFDFSPNDGNNLFPLIHRHDPHNFLSLFCLFNCRIHVLIDAMHSHNA